MYSVYWVFILKMDACFRYSQVDTFNLKDSRTATFFITVCKLRVMQHNINCTLHKHSLKIGNMF